MYISKGRFPPAIISDANILIDYLETDCDIITLVTRHLAPLYIADIVAAEVSLLKDIEPSCIGLAIIETPYSVLIEASERPSSLSLQDFVCMRLAKQRGWGCATNDKALRRECERQDVPVLWGLELMLYLVEKEALKAKRAREVVWAIHCCNKMITETKVRSFIEKLEGLCTDW